MSHKTLKKPSIPSVYNALHIISQQHKVWMGKKINLCSVYYRLR